MQSNKEALDNASPERRRFLGRVGILSLFAVVAAAIRLPRVAKREIVTCTPEKEPKLVRMLAEDGSLVEVDASLIQSAGRKVSDAELQGWIKK